jgi:hypothetical protein
MLALMNFDAIVVRARSSSLCLKELLLLSVRAALECRDFVPDPSHECSGGCCFAFRSVLNPVPAKFIHPDGVYFQKLLSSAHMEACMWHNSIIPFPHIVSRPPTALRELLTQRIKECNVQHIPVFDTAFVTEQVSCDVLAISFSVGADWFVVCD